MQEEIQHVKYLWGQGTKVKVTFMMKLVHAVKQGLILKLVNNYGNISMTTSSWEETIQNCWLILSENFRFYINFYNVKVKICNYI